MKLRYSACMSGYTKLFNSILLSSVWREPTHVKILWITLLALADKDGIVDTSIPRLADMAGIKDEECEEAMAIFMAPDPKSRSKSYQGRRITEFEEDENTKWLILNHEKYKKLHSKADINEKAAKRQQNFRDRKKALNEKPGKPHKMADQETQNDPSIPY